MRRTRFGELLEIEGPVLQAAIAPYPHPSWPPPSAPASRRATGSGEAPTT